MRSSAGDPRPPLESEPISGIGQQRSAPKSDDSASDQAQSASALLAIVDRIEAAVRELVSKPDQEADERKEKREIEDLNAQKDMAQWAKLMFWATGFTVLISGVGVALIWRTLHHTRIAAEYAGEAVSEAQKATKAAESAVAETRRIGEAQVRAYLTISIFNTSSFDVGLRPNVDIAIKNVGQSPATFRRYVAAMVLPHPTTIPPEAWEFEPEPGRSVTIATNEQIFVSTQAGPLTIEQLEMIRREAAFICIFVVVEYHTVFGSMHTERRAFIAHADGPDTLHKWTRNHLQRDLTIRYRLMDEYSKSS